MNDDDTTSTEPNEDIFTDMVKIANGDTDVAAKRLRDFEAYANSVMRGTVSAAPRAWHGFRPFGHSSSIG